MGQHAARSNQHDLDDPQYGEASLWVDSQLHPPTAGTLQYPLVSRDASVAAGACPSFKPWEIQHQHGVSWNEGSAQNLDPAFPATLAAPTAQITQWSPHITNTAYKWHDEFFDDPSLNILMPSTDASPCQMDLSVHRQPTELSDTSILEQSGSSDFNLLSWGVQPVSSGPSSYHIPSVRSQGDLGSSKMGDGFTASFRPWSDVLTEQSLIKLTSLMPAQATTIYIEPITVRNPGFTAMNTQAALDLICAGTNPSPPEAHWIQGLAVETPNEIMNNLRQRSLPDFQPPSRSSSTIGGGSTDQASRLHLISTDFTIGSDDDAASVYTSLMQSDTGSNSPAKSSADPAEPASRIEKTPSRGSTSHKKQRNRAKDTAHQSARSWTALIRSGESDSKRRSRPQDEFTDRPNGDQQRYEAKLRSAAQGIRTLEEENHRLRRECLDLSVGCRFWAAIERSLTKRESISALSDRLASASRQRSGLLGKLQGPS
ncbi:hypothetical protein IAT40_002719 [Kwoniella sp. CBS 6097]